MLDEEVVLKASRNSSETSAMFMAIAIACLPAILMAGSSAIGEGVIIALGILAPINLINSAQNWNTTRNGAIWKFFALLTPYFALLTLAICGIYHPVLKWTLIGGKEFAFLADNAEWTIVSGAFDPIYPITSELVMLSAVACGLALYFVVTSKFVFRKIIIICASVAGVLAVLGICMRIISMLYVNGKDIGFGTNGFSFFSGIAAWSGYAILWQGAIFAAAIYSIQRFYMWPMLVSTRTHALLVSLVLWISVIISGAPIEKAISSLLAALGYILLAIDVVPLKSNFMRHGINPRKSRLYRKFRGYVPFLCYLAAGIFFVSMASIDYKKAIGSDSISFSSETSNALSAEQIKNFAKDTEALKVKRPIFGWGESSFSGIFSFYQGADLSDSAWSSPKSDMDRILIENGKVGFVLSMITPAIFLIVWLYRRKLSLSSLMIGVSLLSVAFLGIVRIPFENIAVVSSFMILMYTFFGWDTSEG